MIVMLLNATPVRAQADEGAVAKPPHEDRTTLHLLLGAQVALLSADMITTANALRLNGDAREGNPILRPFSQRPVALVAVSGAINVLQTYTIIRLHRRHPKIARVWALILVGVEAAAVTNNLRITDRIRTERARR